MPNHDRICLVACVKGKRGAPAPAKDLYRSPWFRKARRYVEQSGAPWFILSDKHGLVHPDAGHLGRVVKLLWQVSNSLIFAIRAGAGYGIAC